MKIVGRLLIISPKIRESLKQKIIIIIIIIIIIVGRIEFLNLKIWSKI
jgi:hypothetical protein